MGSGEAPGRVNLMGDHTDYNGGFVLPVALRLSTWVEVAPRTDHTVVVESADVSPSRATFVVGEENRVGGWIDYVAGATWALGKAGFHVPGFDASIRTTLPLGSGLSSSAALLVATVRALRTTFELPLEDRTIARLAQMAEVNFVGAPVGPMDLLAASLGAPDVALLIDTRSLDIERVPLPELDIVLVDSGVRHAHATGGYRTRRDECIDAAARLRVTSLREVDTDRDAEVAALPAPLDRRVKHVVTENERVIATANALRDGTLDALRPLFAASHRSLRDDFEVSVPAVDLLVQTAEVHPGTLGARLTGGGFGGAVVALAKRGSGGAVARSMLEQALAAGFDGVRVLTVGHSPPVVATGATLPAARGIAPRVTFAPRHPARTEGARARASLRTPCWQRCNR